MNRIDDCFLSRAEVMRRWRISIATVKRLERQGILRPIRMSTHVIRYRLSDVVRAEDEAAPGREREDAGNIKTEHAGDRQAAEAGASPSRPLASI
jgi:hypothetical protein